MTKRTCAVPECETAARSMSADWCEKHYYRLRRTGSLELVPRANREACSVPQCTQEASVRGMCGMVLYAPGDKADRHPCWKGDRIGYSAAHMRVRSAKGGVRALACVNCGGPAQHWSYDHADPGELQSEMGPYSTNPDHYQPRCVPCHKTFDLNMPRHH